MASCAHVRDRRFAAPAYVGHWLRRKASLRPSSCSGSRGSFIGAFSGLREARDLPLEVTLADGTVVGFDWVGEPSQRRGKP